MSYVIPRHVQNAADLANGVTHYASSIAYAAAGMPTHVKLNASQYEALRELMLHQPQGAEDEFVAIVTDADTGAVTDHMSSRQWASFTHLLAALPHLAYHPLPMTLHSGALLGGSGVAALGNTKLDQVTHSTATKVGLGLAVALGLAYFL